MPLGLLVIALVALSVAACGTREDRQGEREARREEPRAERREAEAARASPADAGAA